MATLAETKPRQSRKEARPQWAEAYPNPHHISAEQNRAFAEFFLVNEEHFAKDVTEKMDHGWLRPFLFGYDLLLTGRWKYWFDILQKGHILDAGPIPHIDFKSRSPGIDIGRKMLKNLAGYSPGSAEHFIDWLLWGLGAPIITERPKLDPKEERFFYENFDLMVLLANPTDWFSQYACEEMRQSGLAGYFPTPFDMCILMTHMQIGDRYGAAPMPTSEKVMDPCVGAGAMLLEASNYFLRLYGSDINLWMVKLTALHMWLYAPWGATGDSKVDWGDEAVTANPPEPIVVSVERTDSRPAKYRDLVEFELDTDPTTVFTFPNKGESDGPP